MLVFVFSHGQSVAERVFSINNKVEVDNLKKVSLISQRLVYEFAVSNDLVKSCKLTYS